LTIAVGLLGVLDGLFVPAYWAMTPTVLPKAELTAGNAVGESLMIVAVIVGPLVGGLAMSALPATAVVGVNALTFLVSAATLLMVRTGPVGSSSAPVAGPEPTTEPAPAAVRTAFWEFARGSRLFIAMVLMTGILHLTSAGLVSIALPVFADEHFADGQRAYGLMLGVEGAGLLIGTIAAGLTAGLVRRGYLAVGLLLVHGLVLTAFGFVASLPPLLIGMAVIGLVTGTLSILVITLLQQLSPEHLRGRVMGAFTSVSIGSYPISVIVLGSVVDHGGTRSAFLLGGIGVIAVALTGLSQRAVRNA
jgi:DHA3 family tetracycline resistance protein-like MFS transporter